MNEPDCIDTVALPEDPNLPGNFVRRATWCSNGSAALAQCENRSLLVLEPDRNGDGDGRFARPQRLAIHQASPVLDTAWYPFASSNDPASYCFAASVRECPVKLLDASDGRLRASYRIVDHRERQIAPHSLAFGPTGEKLFCGFEDAIEVFDVACPGEGSRMHTSPSKKSKEGLKGIIAALAFCPSYESNLFAAGTLTPSSAYSSNIALFSGETSTKASPLMFLGSDGTGAGVPAAVTQLRFNPARPNMLYAAFRRHEDIYAWDLRGDVSSPVQILSPADLANGRAKRIDHGVDLDSTNAQAAFADRTNQKIHFDIDSSGNWLATGDHMGNIMLFNLTEGKEFSYDEEAGRYAVQPTLPALMFKAHDDSVGSVSFHPSTSTLLSASGSRHFHREEQAQVDSGSESDSSSDEGAGFHSDVRDERCLGRRATDFRFHPFTSDATMKLWRFNPRSLEISVVDNT